MINLSRTDVELLLDCINDSILRTASKTKVGSLDSLKKKILKFSESQSKVKNEQEQKPKARVSSKPAPSSKGPIS